jgi:hypothetical protein
MGIRRRTPLDGQPVLPFATEPPFWLVLL